MDTELRYPPGLPGIYRDPLPLPLDQSGSLLLKWIALSLLTALGISSSSCAVHYPMDQNEDLSWPRDMCKLWCCYFLQGQPRDAAFSSLTVAHRS